MAKIMVMGVLVNATKGSYEYDIPLEDIATATADRFRLGHALTITKKDGTVIKYGIAKPKEWQAAFGKAMAGDVQDHPGVPEEAAAVKFDAGQETCPTCGRRLPEDQIEAMRGDFNQKRAERLAAINERGRREANKDMIAELERAEAEADKGIAAQTEQTDAAVSAAGIYPPGRSSASTAPATRGQWRHSPPMWRRCAEQHRRSGRSPP